MDLDLRQAGGLLTAVRRILDIDFYCRQKATFGLDPIALEANPLRENRLVKGVVRGGLETGWRTGLGEGSWRPFSVLLLASENVAIARLALEAIFCVELF